ncbi:ATP-dependent DNA helicase RecG [Govanella unica]|uniref:ATP-dependent DNA helicase RecG n=1 Tax=Govanella unica TaxID=2975056 RepID=A0A9X3Z759_9PROT|nr:ATP-dependent DNA helicase RecG [Govania unica]MDA5193639.1 ATP-dependent DNA helicase RecG [Govania unica]
MRPEILFPLFRAVTALKGIGGRTSAHLARIGIVRVSDLLWHLPVGLVDRSYEPEIAMAENGSVATLTVFITGHSPSTPNSKKPYRVQATDNSGDLDLVFFKGQRDYLMEMLPPGTTRIVSGKVEWFNGRLQMSHPDYILAPDHRDRLPLIEPVYGLTAGLTSRSLGRAVDMVLADLPELPEWHDPDSLARQQWPAWGAALIRLHHPEDKGDLSIDSPSRTRLAYDELLANQLALALVRERMRRRKGQSVKGDGRLQARVRAVLPFPLTGAQERAIVDVIADMADPAAMLRLLQGDVGSGKTLVALFAMLAAVEAGGQAAILAPTEILARQHLESLKSYCEAAGVTIGLLTGRDKGKARERILADLAAGNIQILVGTHALFEHDVLFQNLLLAVIDEQHRFGVHQRLKLAGKGQGPVDMLVMTATPIPRTLALTAYGDMDVSKLDEKPPGRQPIDTRTVSAQRFEDVVAGVGRAVGQGQQVYWVCPLVEESETIDLAAATERKADLEQRLGLPVGLIHGRMKGPDKDAAMAAFAAGETRLLVATTVIEVGVNVPNATIMVIEHSERFGLAQLHQLRGRVGRGTGKSSCILIYSGPLGETSKARLAIMRETEDGFRIAEEDMRLRGAGELLGTQQSGLPEFRLADLAHHGDLLAMARDDARAVIEADPELKSPRGQALRVLLYLFERDAAIRYLQSG